MEIISYKSEMSVYGVWGRSRWEAPVFLTFNGFIPKGGVHSPGGWTGLHQNRGGETSGS